MAPGFCPKTVLFRNLGVNLPIFLSGLKPYDPAQMFVFLDFTKYSWFSNQQLAN